MSSTSKETEGTNEEAVPVFNFQPVQRTNVDLFARAPQVRKLSRKDKQKLRLEAQMKEALLEDKTKKVRHDASAQAKKKTENEKEEQKPLEDDELFTSVFAQEDVARELQAETNRRNKAKKKNKKQILRHALHKNEEEDKRTAFVGNLPNTVQKRDVEKLFKGVGAIESVRVRCQTLEGGPEGAAPPPKDDHSAERHTQTNARKGGAKVIGRAVRVLRGEIKKDDDKYSAVAYVLFADSKSVAAAIEQKNGVVFKNRHLIVTSMAPEDAAYPPETSIFLGNIAYDTTEEQVYNYFADKGITDVKRVRLIRDRESGQCKGFGYVEFYKKQSVGPAIETRGAMLNNRPVRIVHTNKSKSVSATSRRDSRKQQQYGGSGSDAGTSDRKRGRDDRRGGASGEGAAPKRQRVEGEKTPSWMGIVTNPRKKMPKDLRYLSDPTKKKGGPKGPRAPVKRKMRNPEKNA